MNLDALIEALNEDVYQVLLTAANRASQEGYAVVIWTPDEIGVADPGRLEDIMIERGAEFIEAHNH